MSIHHAQYRDEPLGLDLDTWRHHYRRHLNLSDMVHTWLRLPHHPRREPWMRVDRPEHVARVVFCRSERYLNWNVDWGRLYFTYGRDAIFLGTPQEHHRFCEY